MDYFDIYTSNCAGSAGNQHIFFPGNENEPITARCFFKVTVGGEYNYSFLFTNKIDSTFGDGSVCRCNVVPDEWKIESLAVSKCRSCSIEKMPEDEELESGFVQLTFNGKKEKTVSPAEIFYTDPIKLNIESGEFLCFEMTFRGRMLPYHEETLLPIFRKETSEWVYNVKMPLPCMIGCDRKVEKRITFIGDSITQGCGTPKNEYLHYSAFVADKLGEEFAFWNIGLGYGRGYDAATDEAWLYKAKQSDVVTVCFGVNDILQGFTAEQVKTSLLTIVQKLKEKGITVIIQTVPPFDYDEKNTATWNEVNSFVVNELSKESDGLFDTVSILSKGGNEPQMSLYGPHPNSEGHRIWGDRLSEYLKRFL